VFLPVFLPTLFRKRPGSNLQRVTPQVFSWQQVRPLPMPRTARASVPHPFRRAWRAGGRSQVRYLRRLVKLGYTDLPIDEEPYHGR
jgi:hypothetical protein